MRACAPAGWLQLSRLLATFSSRLAAGAAAAPAAAAAIAAPSAAAPRAPLVHAKLSGEVNLRDVLRLQSQGRCDVVLRRVVVASSWYSGKGEGGSEWV